MDRGHKPWRRQQQCWDNSRPASSGSKKARLSRAGGGGREPREANAKAATVVTGQRQSTITAHSQPRQAASSLWTKKNKRSVASPFRSLGSRPISVGPSDSKILIVSEDTSTSRAYVAKRGLFSCTPNEKKRYIYGLPLSSPLTHDTRTWKCGELKLYFYQSAGG